MKIKKLIITAVTITTLTYAGIGQVSAEKEEFSPTMQITKNLTTILPDKGEVVADSGENISSYLLKKINKGHIALENGVEIGLCGEKTYLITIGINNYKNISPLKNAISDSKKIANKIESNCKNTKSYTLQNANKKSIMNTLKSVVKKATTKDSVIFYFSGHGLMIQNRSYIIPINANYKKRYSLIDIDTIKNTLESKKIKSGLMIFDAGRSRPHI